jgi:hypothetical protein
VQGSALQHTLELKPTSLGGVTKFVQAANATRFIVASLNPYGQPKPTAVNHPVVAAIHCF